MEKSFKETVQAMSAEEIIMAMVEGLQKPYYTIDMSDFGCSKQKNGKQTCFGCAATNTISKISGIIFKPENIDWEGRKLLLTKNHEEVKFLDRFESAINYLRQGYIYYYNQEAEEINIPKINEDLVDFNLPILNDNYTKKELEVYVKLANTQ